MVESKIQIKCGITMSVDVKNQCNIAYVKKIMLGILVGIQDPVGILKFILI